MIIMVENIKTIKIEEDTDKPLSREDQKDIIEEIKKGYYVPPKLLQSYAKAYRRKESRNFLHILFKLSNHVEGASIKNWTQILQSSINIEKERLKNIEDNKSWYKRAFGR